MKSKIIRILMTLGMVFIAPTLCTNAADKMYVSTETGLNIREVPGLDQSKLGIFSPGTVIEVLEIENNWAEIKYFGTVAYVSADYISEVQTINTGTTNETSRYLGTFTLSHYCPCSACCGWSTGITASGTTATAGRTVGVDTSVIPFGARLLINGQEYIAEDTGSGVNGNWIDIFVASHQEALNLGLKSAEVYIFE